MTYGDVRIEAFTTYMRNFKETNHFEEQITLLDATGKKPKENHKGAVLNIYPEGGGIALNQQNRVRIQLQAPPKKVNSTNQVIIKDDTDTVLNTVFLDSIGSGHFMLLPKGEKSYYAEYGDNLKTVVFDPQETKSYVLSIREIGENIAVRVFSNSGVPKNCMLAIHDGKNIKALEINWDDQGGSLHLIPKTDLYDGMTIFTLFDEYGQALTERYFYKPTLKTKDGEIPSFSIKKFGDSLKLILEDIGDASKFNSLSASILPVESKSYFRNHNLLSYTELIPFTAGAISMPNRFFLNPNKKSFYDLNNELIGIHNGITWSSLSKTAANLQYLPEDGITLYGTVNKGGDNFIVNGTMYGDARSGIVYEGTNTFRIDGIYPIANEKLVLTEVNRKGKFEKPGVFLRFEPRYIPSANFPKIQSQKPVLFKLEKEHEEDPNYSEYGLFQKVTILDEVEVIANKEEKRRDSIKNRSRGRVDFFEIDDTRRNLLLSWYLNQHGFTMVESLDGSVSIVNRSPNNPTISAPVVYLDGFFLNDLSVLYQFRMDIVDYVEIDKSGVSPGRRAPAGVIKIYTDPFKLYKLKSKVFDFGYQVPLGFEPPKTYRVPNYFSFDGKLFEDFGVIAWKPWLKISENNSLELTFPNPGFSDVKIAIDGIVNGNQIISHEMEVKVSDR